MTITYFGHSIDVTLGWAVEGFDLIDFVTRDGVEYGVYQAPYTGKLWAVVK